MRIVAFIAPKRLQCSGSSITSASPLCHRGSPQREDLRHGEEDDSGNIFLDKERFPGDPLAQPEPEYEFDQRMKKPLRDGSRGFLYQ